jgi:hypothetical protein
VAGLLGGLLGIGGGLVIIPSMLFVLHEPYGPGSLHLYKLASLITSVVLSIPATRMHLRAGALVPSLVRPALPIALLGAIVGVLLAGLFAGAQTVIIRRTFGGFMIAVGAWGLLRARGSAWLTRGVAACPTGRRWVFVGFLKGLPAGLIAGFLGVGGGVWMVPAQTMLMGVRMPNAIANSAMVIIVVAAVSAVAMCGAVRSMPDLSLSDGWLLAAWLAPGAIVGGMLGGWLTHRLPVKWLRVAFDLLLVAAGVRLLA